VQLYGHENKTNVPAGSPAAGFAASATGASLACTSAEEKPHYDPK